MRNTMCLEIRRLKKIQIKCPPNQYPCSFSFKFSLEKKKFKTLEDHSNCAQKFRTSFGNFANDHYFMNLFSHFRFVKILYSGRTTSILSLLPRLVPSWEQQIWSTCITTLTWHGFKSHFCSLLMKSLFSFLLTLSILLGAVFSAHQRNIWGC